MAEQQSVIGVFNICEFECAEICALGPEMTHRQPPEGAVQRPYAPVFEPPTDTEPPPPPGTFRITASAIGHGSIDPSGAVDVIDGDDQEFTITPDSGYHIANVLVDGVSVGTGSTYTFSAVADDHTILASFASDATPDLFPSGIYEMSDSASAIANPNVSGHKAWMQWQQVNPSQGIYNWKAFDDYADAAAAAGKDFEFSVRILSHYPQWVAFTPDIVQYTVPEDPRAKMILPWDPVAQPLILQFIEDLCIHFEGRATCIVMGGMGYKTECFMPDPATTIPPIALSVNDYAAQWLVTAKLIVDTYAANLDRTRFIVAGAVVIKPASIGQLAMESLLAYGIANYPEKFGAMNWGLNATSSDQFFMNSWIQANGAGRSTGFQMTGSTDGISGGDTQGPLSECLQRAVDLGADWVEVYPTDCNNADLQETLAFYNELLKANAAM